jgi:5-methylcytosine-specific restriction protein B
LEIDGDKIITVGETAASKETIEREKLKRIYDTFKTHEEITNIVKQIREVGTDIGWTTNYYAVFKALKEFESSVKATEDKSLQHITKKNYVIIIDEINRGNIAQILGELISLIEEDKRIGQPESLEVTLPYSKKKFGVPDNLYIIGTMNTADRSVEALDTALRRRFSFTEILPNPELILEEGMYKNDSDNTAITNEYLSDLLKKINERLEVLLDKDHAIGHSYFLNAENIDDLKKVFQNKIIPLLKEYFFGDYGKIGLVLGEGFIWSEKSSTPNIFADFKEYDGTEFMEKPVYRIADFESEDFDFIDALDKCLPLPTK